jgi:hypothetical protein
MNLSASNRKKSAANLAPARVELLSPRTFFIIAVCLVAAVFAIYGPTLDFQFILDDHRFTSDPRIESSGHVWEYFSNYVWAQFVGGPPSFYRPLFILWLRINFILSEMSPWGWHLLSIVKHLAVAASLGLVVWRLLRDRVAVLIASTLFVLHPAQAESVAWVTVPDPLMSIGVLGSVLLYLRYARGVPRAGVDGKKSRKAPQISNRAPSAVFWLIVSAVVCLAAMLAKETAIILPVVILVLALLVQRDEHGRINPAKKGAGSSTRLLRALREMVPFACVTAFYLLLRFNALGVNLASRTQQLPRSTVLLSSPSTLWFYVKVLLWPVHSRAFADPDLSEGFSVKGVLLPGLGVGCAIGMLAWTLFWAWRKARRELAFQEASAIECALLIGTLLLVLPILLALNLNVLNPGDFLHGRYTYLPSAGLMLLLATGWHMAGKARVPLLFAGGLLAFASSVLVVSQEKQWKDDLTVFTVAHQFAPHNAPVAENFAKAQVQSALQLADEGRCSEAMPVFERVTQEYPHDWFAWAGLGGCFVQINDLPKAEEALHKAADLSHETRMMQQWQLLREHMGLPRSLP